MAAIRCFIAEDYSQAFNLQILFYEYVELFTQLTQFNESETVAISAKKRHELEVGLQEKLNEITLMTLMMKNLKSHENQLNKTFIPTLRVSKYVIENRNALH